MADTLREYKHVVLGLIFLKFIMSRRPSRQRFTPQSKHECHDQ